MIASLKRRLARRRSIPAQRPLLAQADSDQDDIDPVVDSELAPKVYGWAQDGNVDELVKCVAAGADLSIPDKTGVTAWQYLAFSGNVAGIIQLINTGYAIAPSLDDMGSSIWHYLAGSGKQVAIQQAIQSGFCRLSDRNRKNASLFTFWKNSTNPPNVKEQAAYESCRLLLAPKYKNYQQCLNHMSALPGICLVTIIKEAGNQNAHFTPDYYAQLVADFICAYTEPRERFSTLFLSALNDNVAFCEPGFKALSDVCKMRLLRATPVQLYPRLAQRLCRPNDYATNPDNTYDKFLFFLPFAAQVVEQVPDNELSAYKAAWPRWILDYFDKHGFDGTKTHIESLKSIEQAHYESSTSSELGEPPALVLSSTRSTDSQSNADHSESDEVCDKAPRMSPNRMRS